MISFTMIHSSAILHFTNFLIDDQDRQNQSFYYHNFSPYTWLPTNSECINS